jgi:tetratricopeptide (TPR) repeat protein
MTAWKNGDLVRARSLFEKSIRKTSNGEKKSVAFNQLGLVLWQIGETEAAVAAFGQSCALTDTLTGANLNLGIALFHSERYDEAEIALNNILGDTPTNQTARTMLGLVEMRQGNWLDASRELTRSVTANPSDSASQNALALTELHSSRNTDNAIKRLKQILAAAPDYAPAAYNLAVIYERWLGNRSAALDWYKTYLQKAGADGSHVNTAKQAVARLDEPLADPPPPADRLTAEGAQFYADRKYAKAVESYRKAIMADPTQKTTHYNLGLALYALAKYPEAAQACSEALRIDPRFADARYMLSLSYFRQKKWGDAEREARALNQIDKTRGAEMMEHISTARKN